MSHHITVVRVGPDPFGRGEPTVFYRDTRITRFPDGGRVVGRHDPACGYETFDRAGNPADEVYYLWLKHWPTGWPSPGA